MSKILNKGCKFDNIIFDYVVFSDTAINNNIDNSANVEELKNAEVLFDNCINLILNKFNSIKISSWFRCIKLNSIISSCKPPNKSEHTKGFAVDFLPVDDTIDDIFLWIKYNLNFTQLIIEKNKSGKRWIHLSYNPSNLKKQILWLEDQENK